MTSSKRFEALDSFRGIAALMVAFYHFMMMDGQTDLSANVQNHIIRNLWLFTDFFFVLSGFVLSYRYYARATPIQSLLKSRFYRLFPLHWFTMILACGMVLAVDGMSLDLVLRLIVNGTNAQIFFSQLDTLNAPSWSISVEFYFSILLGIVFVLLPSRFFIVAALATAILCAAGLFFLTQALNVTYGFGWIRGLLGLSVGCVIWFCYQKLSRYDVSFWWATLLEFVAVSLLACSIVIYARIWFLWPVFLYGLIVMIYAREAGALSIILKRHVFLYLGKISYSLYLNHLILLLLIQSVLLICGITHDMMINGDNPWILPAALAVYIAVLLPCSAWTYKYVECYWQNKSKK